MDSNQNLSGSFSFWVARKHHHTHCVTLIVLRLQFFSISLHKCCNKCFLSDAHLMVTGRHLQIKNLQLQNILYILAHVALQHLSGLCFLSYNICWVACASYLQVINSDYKTGSTHLYSFQGGREGLLLGVMWHVRRHLIGVFVCICKTCSTHLQIGKSKYKLFHNTCTKSAPHICK